MLRLAQHRKNINDFMQDNFYAYFSHYYSRYKLLAPTEHALICALLEDSDIFLCHDSTARNVNNIITNLKT